MPHETSTCVLWVPLGAPHRSLMRAGRGLAAAGPESQGECWSARESRAAPGKGETAMQSRGSRPFMITGIKNRQGQGSGRRHAQKRLKCT